VERAAIAETTALGAALLAGLQIGVFGSLHDVARRWHSGGAFHPGLDAGRRDALYAGWHEAVRRSFSKTGAA
jgi:glycerol kinase